MSHYNNSLVRVNITDMKISFRSESANDTMQFAKNMATKLKGGEVIELIGDVGAGKTTFVIGLAEGLGSKDHVSSPTFTICNTYQGRLTIQHADFYRLHDDKLIQKELDELIAADTVVVLEWSENLTNPLKDTIQIIVTPGDGDERNFEVKLSSKHGYLK
jgi:tRNA threonylcarbamoyladenosine biosynthesis protein TsaE